MKGHINLAENFGIYLQSVFKKGNSTGLDVVLLRNHQGGIADTPEQCPWQAAFFSVLAPVLSWGRNS